jgi:hypothetical protein
LTRSSQALLEAQSQQKQLQELKASGAAEQAIKDFSARLANLLESKKAPASATPAAAGTTKEEGQIVLSEVQERLGALYTVVTSGAAAPTAAAVAAARSAGQDVERLEQQWQQLQAGLPALNQTLRQARLAPVRTGLAPPRNLNAADED